MTELRTERLLLRPFRASDEAFVLDLHARPEVMRFIGDGRPKTTGVQARQAIERFNSFGDAPLGAWAIEGADERMHGAVLLKDIPSSSTGEPSGEIEIGWRLHPDSWGRGIGSEAARRVLDHAWAGGLTRLVAVLTVTPLEALSSSVDTPPLATTGRSVRAQTSRSSARLGPWSMPSLLTSVTT